MRVSLELRALICERERPQDDNLNCRGQRGEKIVRILREGFIIIFSSLETSKSGAVLIRFLRVKEKKKQQLKNN